MVELIINFAIKTLVSYVRSLIFSVDKKQIYVSALGPSSSGKTTLHNFLRNTKYEDATIGHNDLEKIVLKINDKELTIKKGKDIAGSEQAVKSYYKEELQLSDVSFFIFDSSKILENEAYSKNVNGRLNFINKHCKTIKKDEIKIILIASHFDKVKNQSSAKKMIWNKIDKIASEGKINKPIYINLTDRLELEKLKNEIFF